MLVPISRLVKSFSMKVSRILSFTFFTFNIVWGKLKGGGTPTSWAPTRTLCALHQGTWLSAQPFTLARWVKCMCIVSKTIPSDDWAIPAYNAQVVVSWGAIHSIGWTGGKKPATFRGWFWSSHFFTDLAQHFFPVTSRASWAAHAFPKMRSLVSVLTRL